MSRQLLPAAQSSQEDAPPSAKLGHWRSIPACGPLTTKYPLCPNPQPAPEPKTPFPSLLPELSLPGPLPTLVPICLRALPQPSYAHLGTSSEPSSLPQVLSSPQTTSLPPQTTHRHCLQSQDTPGTPSTLPYGQAPRITSQLTVYSSTLKFKKYYSSPSLSVSLSCVSPLAASAHVDNLDPTEQPPSPLPLTFH